MHYFVFPLALFDDNSLVRLAVVFVSLMERTRLAEDVQRRAVEHLSDLVSFLNDQLSTGTGAAALLAIDDYQPATPDYQRRAACWMHRAALCVRRSNCSPFTAVKSHAAQADNAESYYGLLCIVSWDSPFLYQLIEFIQSAAPNYVRVYILYTRMFIIIILEILLSLFERQEF